MPAEHPRGDADVPHDESGTPDGDPNDPHGDANDPPDRRTFLRRTAGVGAAAVGVGAVAVGDARGQEGTVTTTADAREDEDTVTTKGALPADAPTFENTDYTGMFVHVGGVNQNASTRNVSGCSFVNSDDAVVAYEATIIDRVAEDHPQARTLLFARVDDDTVAYGKLFIINRQWSCGSGHVQVQLEEVGAATLPTGGEGTETATRLPGLGVGATVAGLLGGGELLRRRGSDEGK